MPQAPPPPRTADHRPYLPAPDYARPLLEVSPAHRERIVALLAVLYGRKRAEACWPEVERLMRVHWAHKPDELIAEERGFDPANRFSERDTIAITYGDLLDSPGKPPLRALADFLDVFMKDALSTVHILPFFPYSSDRGFSVVDFEEVDPRLGSWQQIEALARRYRLMFDGVFNHASAKSRWFQEFLDGHPDFQDAFVAFSTKDAISSDHLRLILRPRTTELLTSFQTIHGKRFVWTTFSPDQVDLNFKSEKVLLRVLGILLAYVRRGADIVRLDAVTYIWRELGTRCAHLKETHALVKLFRAVLDGVAPRVAIVTETNVPHADNVSYFGDGHDEAQMVYNFALPPLVIHAFHEADASYLSSWAKGLVYPSATTTFFNFLASHDGVGLLGAQGILPPAGIELLVRKALEHGGLVSEKDNGDGTRSPYELNVTWWSALNRDDADEPQRLQVDRFLASRAIALALRGVPGIYLPSLFGARNDLAAIRSGAEKRSINRKTLSEAALMSRLMDLDSTENQVAAGFRRLMLTRIAQPAFHPNAPQRVLDAGPGVFALLRWREGGQRILALTSVRPRDQNVAIALADAGGAARAWRPLLHGHRPRVRDGRLHIHLAPYEVAWLEAKD